MATWCNVCRAPNGIIGIASTGIAVCIDCSGCDVGMIAPGSPAFMLAS